MTKPDAIAPIIGLESTVSGGRTVQAYKRGGEDEARERLIEETTSAVVWLAGVKVLNDHVGDPILKKMFGENFDVGSDKLRTPFENFMKTKPPKGYSKKTVAIIKGIKVLASIVLADAFIGLVLPPLNHKLTKNIAKKKAQESQANDTIELSNKQNENNPSFKGGGIGAINVFTNAIENTNTGKLLSTDAGLVSGRMYSARNNDERREIAIRDIGSIYFYMWAQGHVGNILNYIESGRATRLNPNSTKILDEHLSEFLKRQGGEMTVEEFKKSVLGKNPSEIKLPTDIEFESAKLSKYERFMDKFRKNPTEPLKVIEVDKLEGTEISKNKEFFERIKAMSKLQPLRQGKSVVTKQQIIDAINVSEINNSELLDKVFHDFTKGAHKDPYKYVSNSKLYGLKSQMEDYIKDICKHAKNGKINKDILKKAKNSNLIFSGINFAAGFTVAALFLSTLIPKFQYWVTRQKTGKNEFPGLYDIES